MYLAGGEGISTYFNDIWYSTDGVTWICVELNNDWEARRAFGFLTFTNKLYVLGGINSSNIRLNDVYSSINLISELVLGSSDTPFSATGTALGALIADGNGSGQLVYGAMPGAETTEPSVSGNKTKFSIAREFTNNSGADITVREVGLFSGSDMLARLILANPVTIANGGSEIITVDFETEV